MQVLCRIKPNRISSIGKGATITLPPNNDAADDDDNS